MMFFNFAAAAARSSIVSFKGVAAACFPAVRWMFLLLLHKVDIASDLSRLRAGLVVLLAKQPPFALRNLA